MVHYLHTEIHSLKNVEATILEVPTLLGLLMQIKNLDFFKHQQFFIVTEILETS